MADSNFSGGQRCSTSPLSGPQGPFPSTKRYKRSLTLKDAGPYTRLLKRQCLHLLHDLNDEIERANRYARTDPRKAGEVISDLTPRVHWVCLLLRACIDRDPAVSVAQVVRVLQTYQAHMLRMATAPRFRQW